MINKERWINSLPKINTEFSKTENQLDHERWVDTIPKINTYNAVKKYSLMAILFVCGLSFVSVVKNETRNLEKEINYLRSSNNIVRFNLEQAILDNAVITSPENISRLAKEYLNTNFVFYKKSQIRQLDVDTKTITKINKKKNNLSENIKLGITKEIEKKRTEIQKLRELYSKPESIPGEIKTQVTKKIEKKKIELKNLYTSPKETITLKKAQKWGIVQVVKAFLGMPIIPGK